MWRLLGLSIIAALEKALSFNHWREGLRGTGADSVSSKMLRLGPPKGVPLLHKVPFRAQPTMEDCSAPQVISQIRPRENTGSAMRKQGSWKQNKERKKRRKYISSLLLVFWGFCVLLAHFILMVTHACSPRHRQTVKLAFHHACRHVSSIQLHNLKWLTDHKEEQNRTW